MYVKMQINKSKRTALQQRGKKKKKNPAEVWGKDVKTHIYDFSTKMKAWIFN